MAADLALEGPDEYSFGGLKFGHALGGLDADLWCSSGEGVVWGVMVEIEAGGAAVGLADGLLVFVPEFISAVANHV